MRRLFYFLISLSILFPNCKNAGPPSSSVLVFTKTETFRHASIDAGIEAVKLLCAENNISVEFTELSSAFSEENLQKFNAVIFLNTSGDVLDNTQQADFQRFIEAGGGFVGVHGAAATEYDWSWYGNLVGAYLSGHPEVQKAKVEVLADGQSLCDSGIGSFEIMDEWYNYRQVPPVGKVWVNAPNTQINKSSIGPIDSLRQLEKHIDPRVAWTYNYVEPYLLTEGGIKVLMEVDEGSYTGGKHGKHPISWMHEYEGGRSFYTGLGHTIESYSDENFLCHLLGGIKYAIGQVPLDFSKTKTSRIPNDERFVRTVLADNLNEPMELEILPDNRVVFIERRGAMKIYDPIADTVETVLQMPVYDTFEEGFLGMALDPNWSENQWMYLYYSLMEGGRRNRLSRFVFDGKMLHISSEKIMLEVPELNGCCHTGGSIEFGPDGVMYLSTGDNTNPFESDGYGPFDERPGRALWDAQKSSANPNDLRGKVLRIIPKPDGSYSIPEGNLFPEGTPNTRPEIFVMGCRNPFRISIDSKTGCLFWGDVGPDAGKDGQVRGPKGYDTFNRACEAGFYGWPYLRGNHVYQDYDFGSKRSLAHFDPEKIINNSPNNTGRQELPPVQHPLIWYSYDESTEFPWTGIGGKNPMAGPIFHAADFAEGANVFPPYFEDKFIVYEWMRNWLFVVTLDENGDYVTADPFLSNEKFVRPMDMEFGPDGALYILEYGEVWFSSNPEARLNKIEFAPANRKPIAKITSPKTIGAAPLSASFSASESVDYDGDKMEYAWSITGTNVQASGVNFNHSFNRSGVYEVQLKVTDAKGASSVAKSTVQVGNEPPSIALKIDGNNTFYWDDATIDYKVLVNDLEDGTIGDQTFDLRRLNISIDYLKEGKDIAQIVLGHQTQGMAASNMKFAGGKILIDNSDCSTCHALAKRVNGPSYTDIANRYIGDATAADMLANKIISGGGGNWGETNMAAHPQITKEEAQQIVAYILSLSGELATGSSLPAAGSYTTAAHPDAGTEGAYIFQASYFDKGGDGIGSQHASETLVLKYPKIEAERYVEASKGIRSIKDSGSGSTILTGIFHDRYLAFPDIDLTGVGKISFQFFEGNVVAGTTVEVRKESANGPLIGEGDFGNGTNLEAVLDENSGVTDLFFIFKNEGNREQELGRLDWIDFSKRQTNRVGD